MSSSLSSTSSTISTSMFSSSARPRRPTPHRSHSSSSTDSTISPSRNSLLLQISSLDDLTHAEPLSSSDPLSQNFSFDDVFDYHDSFLPSSSYGNSNTGSTNVSRKKSISSSSATNKTKVVSTLPRAPFPSTQRRRSRPENQSTTSTSKMSSRQQIPPTTFSFSHYPSQSQFHLSTTLDHTIATSAASRRGSSDFNGRGIPSRTSSHAVRLHEMLARGR